MRSSESHKFQLGMIEESRQEIVRILKNLPTAPQVNPKPPTLYSHPGFAIGRFFTEPCTLCC